MRPGDMLVERFVVEDTAIRGGIGTVHRGWDIANEAPVAIKMLTTVRPTDVARFHREAALLAELRAPGIVRYVHHGETPRGEPYLVMEWLEGETVAARMERHGFDVASAVALVRTVASALAHLHERGVVHRDIKPENLVLVAEAPTSVVLIDLGLARAAAAGPQRVTATGVVLGTPGYMAPEQVRGESAVAPAADVFALGCLLYECCTGYPAFAGENFLAVRTKIMLAEPPSIAELSPEAPAKLARLVARMIAKRPADRPPSGADVVRELDALGPLAPGPARLANAARPATDIVATSAPVEAAMWLGVVLARSAELDPDALRALAADVELDILDGGYLVFTASHPQQGELARELAKVALGLRDRLAKARIVIGTGTAAVDVLIDRLARSLDLAMFAPAPGGVVFVDPGTASVAPDFVLEHIRGGIVLHGLR
jgi:eukaryotic-like serine/threonine-protein kinase